MIEDYRAGAGCDDEDDKIDLAKGKKLACPVQVLWDARRPSPIALWRRWVDRVERLGTYWPRKHRRRFWLPSLHF